MKKTKKTVLKGILCLLALFLLFNVGWYVWRAVKYGAYAEGMEVNPIPEWLVPRYKLIDADGYDYGLKYPDYLSFTGNMSVGTPAEDDPFSDFLIVWPKPAGGYTYGVALTEDGKGYQIYIGADGSAVDPEYAGIVARHQDTIDELLRRAEAMWDLE